MTRLPIAWLGQASTPQGGDIRGDARPYNKQTPMSETWFTVRRQGIGQLRPDRAIGHDLTVTLHDREHCISMVVALFVVPVSFA
jgi:hypothetical protein